MQQKKSKFFIQTNTIHKGKNVGNMGKKGKKIEEKERLRMGKQLKWNHIKKKKYLPAGVFGPGLAGWGFLENNLENIKS